MKNGNPLLGIGGAPTRATTLPTDAAGRKEFPVASGCLDYFPDALCAVSKLSKIGNDQHNKGQALHWARGKSGDESDTMIRHFLQRGTVDSDGVRHSVKMAWRALALLQKELEAEQQNEGPVVLEPAYPVQSLPTYEYWRCGSLLYRYLSGDLGKGEFWNAKENHWEREGGPAARTLTGALRVTAHVFVAGESLPPKYSYDYFRMSSLLYRYQSGKSGLGEVWGRKENRWMPESSPAARSIRDAVPFTEAEAEAFKNPK